MKRSGRTVAVIASIFIALIGVVGPAAPAAAMPAAPVISSSNAQTSGMVATVWVTLLNVRRAPRITSSTKGRLVKDEQILMIGRVSSGAWVEVQTRFGTGWVDRGWITYDGTIFDLPIVPVLPPFVTTFNGTDGTNVRRGPNDQYPIIGNLSIGTEADIVGVSPKPQWFLIITQNGMTGWVFSGAVDLTGDLINTPLATALPVGTVNTYNLQVHTAPNENAPVIGDIRLGTSFAIIGRDYRTNWWQIEGKFGTGWVWANFMITVGDTNFVPITDGSGPGVAHPVLQ